MADRQDIEASTFIEHRVKTGESLQSIAESYGLTWQALALFNFGTDEPREVNHCLHAYTGCRQRTKDRKNFIFTSSDVPGVIYVPKPKLEFGLATGTAYRLHLKGPTVYSRVEVQTVDDFGHRLGNVDLVLLSEKGAPDIKLHTGADGYGKLDKVVAGKYRVLRSDGQPVYFTDNRRRPSTKAEDRDRIESLAEAILDTRLNLRAITSVVCPGDISDGQHQERLVARQIYARTNASTSLEGRGEETAVTTKASAWYCADNLALAAGWTPKADAVDIKGLVSKVLRGYLRDYHPTAIARGYYVLSLEPETRKLSVISEQGEQEASFSLASEVKVQGLLGAYAMFEDVSGEVFVDLASMRNTIGVPSEVSTGDIDLDELLDDPEPLVQAVKKHANKVQILFYMPTAQQLAALALLGGTGRLEDYGHDKSLNDSIHQRNLAVCRNICAVYDGYVSQYIAKVEKTAGEDELRTLGPPRTPYEMPIPVGSTDRQRLELFDALKTKELDAWGAIAHQLDHFAGRMSQGYPYLRFKPKFIANPKSLNKIKNYLRPGIADISEKLPVEVEVELNIDIQLVDGNFEILTKSDASIKAKVSLDGPVNKVTKRGVPVEIAFTQSLREPEKRKVTVKISQFQLDYDTTGKMKLSILTVPGVAVDSEANPRSGVFGAGLTFKGKDLAKLMHGRSARLDKWAGILESMELQVQVGLVGTREETILATTSLAPGFFERRSLKELVDLKTQWVDLTLDEQQSLATLGWYGSIWDGRCRRDFKDKLPESLGKSPDELTAAEKVSIVRLGFYAYEDYAKAFKKAAAQAGKKPDDAI
jgi:hypothetical protein